MTIFIVDDEPLIHQLLGHIFELMGYKVIGDAYDGVEALRMYRSLVLSYRKPDLIIMNHLMPKKDGIETALEILEIDHSAKILFLSVDESAEERAFEIGAVGFIKKPFEMSKLLNAVKEFKPEKT